MPCVSSSPQVNRAAIFTVQPGAALRLEQPDVECVGFGGERMEAAGCRLLYPLCRLAVMWLLRVLPNALFFVRPAAPAPMRYFRRQRPDAVILIDYPGFNWWLARRRAFARHSGVLLRAAAALGLGRLRVKKIAPLRRSRAVQPAV